jgi:hypothetical protein
MKAQTSVFLSKCLSFSYMYGKKRNKIRQKKKEKKVGRSDAVAVCHVGHIWLV